MARKSYPSDHRRYFRVMEDILDNDGYRNLSAHDKVAWIDLLALFNRRKAHLTDNSIVLAWSTAMEVLSSRNRRGAVATASRLRREVDAHFARVERGLLCLIPKWSEMQGLTPKQLQRDSVEIPPPTPTPTPKELTPSELGAGAPAWGPLRRLRPKKVEKLAWERFLRDNFQAMRLWLEDQQPRPTWPATVRRFWNQKQGPKEKTIEMIAHEAERLYDQDLRSEIPDHH